MFGRIVSNQCVRGSVRNGISGSEKPKNTDKKSAVIVAIGLLALGAEYYASNNTPKEYKGLQEDD